LTQTHFLQIVLRAAKKKQGESARSRSHTHPVFVAPAGIEPASSESESEILSPPERPSEWSLEYTGYY
jgi:hypothetical protein